MRKILLATLLLLTSYAALAQTALSPDADIRKVLVDRIDRQKQGVGMVVGIVTPTTRRVIAYDNGDTHPVDGDTIFEIGSVTKVFTSLLLADMVQRGEVKLTDPVAKYLPAGVKVPERNGKVITLEELAMHTSGLPHLPSNISPKDVHNPYADYTAAQLDQFLSSYQLTRDPGTRYEYSNLGGGLLGYALSRRAGVDYETLVRTRICEPLHMNSTTITLSEAMKKRLVMGHNAELKPVPNWDLGVLAGAGAIRSTANDLMTFLAANLGITKTPLAPAMAAMLQPRHATGMANLEIALAWHIFTEHGRTIVWHNGGTGGYRSFIGFDPTSRIGVVVLSNAFTIAGVDDIGHHLLDPEVPLLQPREAVKVDPKLFDGYVGRYEIRPGFIVNVTRDGNQLFVQATGQPRIEVFPSGDRDFFMKVADVRFTFEPDAHGRATALVIHQNGVDTPAKRIEGEPAPVKEHKAIAVDPKLFDGYVGRYALTPAFVITVTREGDHLFIQATGQPRFEVFPDSDRDYFLKAVDAQITFQTDAQGHATGLVLHQNGADMPAKRVD